MTFTRKSLKNYYLCRFSCVKKRKYTNRVKTINKSPIIRLNVIQIFYKLNYSVKRMLNAHWMTSCLSHTGNLILYARLPQAVSTCPPPKKKKIYPYRKIKFKNMQWNIIIFRPARFLQTSSSSFLFTLQSHPTRSEPDGIHCGYGWGLAQLSSRVPMGLQGSGDRRIPVEHNHPVVRPVLQNWMGVQSQDAVQKAHPGSGHQARRRKLARGAGNDGAHRGL